MLGDGEKPDVTYADIGGNDIQKQEIREAVELPLSNPGLYAQVCIVCSSCAKCLILYELFPSEKPLVPLLYPSS